MLGDGIGVDPLRTGEPDPARHELFSIELVGSRADRLNEPQPRRLLEQVVLPHAGYDDDIGFGNALFEFICRAHAEAVDAGLSRLKALLQLIGDVRKANGETILGWKHFNSPKAGLSEAAGAKASLLRQQPGFVGVPL